MRNLQGDYEGVKHGAAGPICVFRTGHKMLCIQVVTVVFHCLIWVSQVPINSFTSVFDFKEL